MIEDCLSHIFGLGKKEGYVFFECTCDDFNMYLKLYLNYLADGSDIIKVTTRFKMVATKRNKLSLITKT